MFVIERVYIEDGNPVGVCEPCLVKADTIEEAVMLYKNYFYEGEEVPTDKDYFYEVVAVKDLFEKGDVFILSAGDKVSDFGTPTIIR